MPKSTTTPTPTPTTTSTTKNAPTFPVAKQARKQAKQALASSSDPTKTISNFQQTHSLHSFLSKAFGTTSIHSLQKKGVSGGGGGGSSGLSRSSSRGGDGGGGGGSSSRSLSGRTTRGDVQLNQNREQQGVTIEPLELDSVLTFLNHLGVGRYDIHKKICDVLRVRLETAIQRFDLNSKSSSAKSDSAMMMTSAGNTTTTTGSSSGSSSSGLSSSGRETLLKLLMSSWDYIHVDELRPIFVTLIKKLGDQTPNEFLLVLAKRDTATDSVNSLKYGELLNQFGTPMKRIIWEADWSSVVRGDGQLVPDMNTNTSTNNNTTGTLYSSNILSDMVRPIVIQYVTDFQLKKASDLAFPSSIRERKMDTMKRRSAISSTSGTGSGGNNGTNNNSGTGTLSSLTSKGLGKSIGGGDNNHNNNNSNNNNTAAESETNTAGAALAKLKQIMGSCPKILSAVLNMIVAEHGLQFKPLVTNTTDSTYSIYDNNKKGNNKRSRTQSRSRSRSSIMGGSGYLHCTLVSDILLSYGQLPKQYEYLQILAQVLDESVRKGLISDQAIAQIQGCLRAIFQPISLDKDSDKKANPTTNSSTAISPGKKKNKTSDKEGGSSTTASSGSKTKSAADRNFELKLLRKIVKGAVARMKDNDRQACFLNPVTDDIAPGYSKVITKPICLSAIEENAINLEYTSMNKFENDVQLMFANCIRYNIGKSGQWFRGEARRQQKRWKDTILKASKDKYNEEMNKRGKANEPPPVVTPKKKVIDDAERIRIQQQNLIKKLKEGKKSGEKRSFQPRAERDDNTITGLLAEDVNPLSESRNKRRKTDTDIPSMPALASILLSDPFVVRLLLFKILNAMKNVVIKNNDIPANHKTLPSVMQILYVVQISTQLCSKKGKVYVIPDIGFNATTKPDSDDKGGSVSESYVTLRKYTPLVTKLMLEAEIDKRFSVGGDFHSHLSSARPETKAEEWAGSTSSSSVLLCLAQGALISLLQPSASNEMSLLLQLPRFFIAVNEISGGNMVNESTFFKSLTSTILKQKHKLPHSVRDLIVKQWLCWFKSSDGSSSITGAVHLSFIHLLNEWSSLGNRILPRDLLLSFSEDAIKAAEANESDKTSTFSHFWDTDALGEVKEEYERMLKSIPEERCIKWKHAVGLQQTEESTSDVEMKDEDSS